MDPAKVCNTQAIRRRLMEKARLLLRGHIQVAFDALRSSVEASTACGAITLAASVREFAPSRVPRPQPPPANMHNSAPDILARSGSPAVGSASDGAPGLSSAN
jgi:hypothetical protein